MGKIHINGMRFYAYHGCMEQETKIGGEYMVDVVISTDLNPSADSDNLDQTVDYCAVWTLVSEEMKTSSKLIEHVCKRIIVSLTKNLSLIEAVEVKVTKFAPPIDGDCKSVSVTLEA